MVLNNQDSGADSLRKVMANAHNGDTVVFASNVIGQTITLTSGDLSINRNITIMVPAGGNVTISGNNSNNPTRVFTVGKGAKQVTLIGLTISNGLAANGGGILNEGTLTLNNCIVSGNKTQTGGYLGTNNGGGIDNYGSLTLSGGTTVSNNFGADGGGIYNHSTATLTLNNSSVSGNTLSPSASK
jgi:hypothetical protein